MPVYNTQSPPPFLGRDYPLNQYLLFSAEAIQANEFSQQVSFDPGISAMGGRIEIDFNKDPGACEFYVMESSYDLNGVEGYDQVPVGGDLKYASITVGPNGKNTRLSVDFQPLAGPFFCLFVLTGPSNANVTCTARIARVA